ncbi:MAG TPA: DJ-1 family protein [Ruminococcaceae bacterium]|nr:DJ-1 family protein [Oscillospiraceae bacterium]
MIAVFLAMGFEEIEALAVVDILRRAELDVVTIGVGGRTVRGSHGIVVAADIEDTQASLEGLEAVVLPGGMPGTLNLEHSEVVQKFLDVAIKKELPICAICAAPSILGHRGLLAGRKAVCFPGYEDELTDAEITNSSVVVDGPFITARGAGVAIEFALRIVAEIASKERAEKIKASMQCVS